MENTHLIATEFYQGYLKFVKGKELLTVLEGNSAAVLDFFGKLEKEKWAYRYQPGKWSIQEILLHLIDTEKVMAYRALCIARFDQTNLPGFEQDDYVAHSFASLRTPESLLEEYGLVRKNTLFQFKNFTSEALQQVGKVNGGAISAIALGFIIAGHELHHLKVLEERYM